MNRICINIPALQQQELIELEVTLAGKKRLMNYRLDAVDCAGVGTETEARIERIQEFIRNYDPSWELVQIGAPEGNLVPIMFRLRERFGEGTR